VLPHATAERLHECVFSSWLERRPFDIVHFIGHGEFARQREDDDSQGQLLFHSIDGGVQRVNVRTLREILCNRGIQIVFLNACDTARDARGHLNRGVGQALMEGGLPAVVANQYSVLDPSAVAFAQYLYWAIAQGASIGEAAREARIAVNYSITGDLIDWAVPVVYARDPNYRLCRLTARVTPLSNAPSPAASFSFASAAAVARRDDADRERVGVADIAGYFPELRTILDRFNEVQERFAFREVKIAVPLGVWDRIDGQRRLNARRFANRITDKVAALGLDYLACVTNWWLREDGYEGEYTVWTADDVPIVAISTAGTHLQAHGPDTGRAVANCLVATIGEHMLGSKTNRVVGHARGPRSCPFYVNRTDKPLTQRLAFDDVCRRRLLKALGEDTVAAFEALLGAYDA
jgi:hypothetical protein